MKRYIYKGDKLTDPALKDKECIAVLRPDGKCICAGLGKVGMLVAFGEKQVVVNRRLLRKIN